MGELDCGFIEASALWVLLCGRVQRRYLTESMKSKLRGKSAFLTSNGSVRGVLDRLLVDGTRVLLSARQLSVITGETFFILGIPFDGPETGKAQNRVRVLGFG